MNIHEYQAKQLLAKYGILVPKGGLATTPTEARILAENLLDSFLVIKAQIYAGGRGKSGGIKIATSAAEAEIAAKQILGMTLITHQTDLTGNLVQKIWIEQGSIIERELYLALILNYDIESLSIIVSPIGGINIEEIAKNTPEKIFTIHIQDGIFSLWPFQIRNLLLNCGLAQKQITQGVELIQKLLRLVYEKDITQIEINPLALTKQGDLIALDAKIIFDDNALKHHPDIIALTDSSEDDILELQAKKIGLSYVRLNGNVGTMVNGAGLAMATMDLIKQAGATPANFLDIGGGANEKMVAQGLEIILSDPNVKTILINIFGGILRCDTLAIGVVTAAKKNFLSIPLVIRLEGTNTNEGKRILTESGFSFEIANSITEASTKIAQLVVSGEQ